jgi:YggT family protein
VRVIYGATRRSVKGSTRARQKPGHRKSFGPKELGLAAPAPELYTSDAPGRRRNRAMIELFGFISLLLTLYIYILVAAAVMSWLVAFNVVNPRNQFVMMVGEFLYRITEPVLRPIRNVLPNLGGIDISPIIVIIIIWFIQLVILPVLLRMLIT